MTKLAPDGREVLWSTYLGGAGPDSIHTLALDAQGNVFLAGSTESSDFPRVPAGQTTGSILAVKLDPAGNIVYSTRLGAQPDIEVKLGVTEEGEAYIMGAGTLQAPTPGAALTDSRYSRSGFAIKLTPAGTVRFATYLPDVATFTRSPFGTSPPIGFGFAVERDFGSLLVGGQEGRMYRLSADGSRLLEFPRLPGRIFAMEPDAQGNVYAVGEITGQQARSKSCFYRYGVTSFPGRPIGDVFLSKLRAGDQRLVFTTQLNGSCQTWPASLRVTDGGEATLSLMTFGLFPVLNPVQPGMYCGEQGTGGAAVLMRLSSDGSAMRFSSFLQPCQRAGPIALAPDGAVYTSTYNGGSNNSFSAMLRVAVQQRPSVVVNAVTDAFSGGIAVAFPGHLISISGENLASETIELPLDRPGPLPIQLGGVQVLFNGQPAGLLRASPTQIICAPPDPLRGSNQVLVQISSAAGKSTSFALAVPAAAPVSLLTHNFPEPPLPGTSVNGHAVNEDGTLNSASNPAAHGSIVTVYSTGQGLAGTTVPILWNAPPFDRLAPATPLTATASTMDGFIEGLVAIRLPIPTAPGPGVNVLPTPGVLTRVELGRVGSGAGIYIK